MNLLPFKIVNCGRGSFVVVDNRHRPLYFDISNTPEAEVVMNNFVEYGAPGTGFFVRPTSSHFYRDFVANTQKRYRESVIGYLFGHRFNYNKETARAHAAAACAKHPIAKRILECYASMLSLAEQAEEQRRVVFGIRRRGRHLSGTLSYAMKEAKSEYRSLTNQAKVVRYNVSEMCPREQYEHFLQVHAAFSKLTECRRILHQTRDNQSMISGFHRVVFDMAVLDYISMPKPTPMMRDTEGNGYFIYPTFVVKACGSTELEVYDMKDLHFLYQEVSQNLVSEDYMKKKHTSHKRQHRNYDVVGVGLLVKQEDRLLDEAYAMDRKQREHVVAELTVPELDLHFYASDVSKIHQFYKAINEYQQTYFAAEK